MILWFTSLIIVKNKLPKVYSKVYICNVKEKQQILKISLILEKGGLQLSVQNSKP